MTVVVAGISHKTAPMNRVGDFKINPEDLEHSLGSLSSRFIGLAILSTCNRTEIYAETDGEATSEEEIRACLAALDKSGGGLNVDEAYVLHGKDVVSHLTRVATGLESAIIGEPHIVGQISDAFACSADLGISSPSLTELFHHAIRAGRRIRRTAGISARPPSIATLAIAAAEASSGGYPGKSVFTIGAGDIGEEIALGIQRKDVAARFITSRSLEKAESLSSRADAYPIAFSQMPDSLVAVDIVFTCTSSDSPILSKELLRETMRARANHPLVIVDLAVPGDVEPGSGDIDGITLIDIDELQNPPPGRQMPSEILNLAEELVIQETARFKFPTESAPGELFVRELALLAENIRRSELERTASRLSTLAPAERLAIEHMTKSIVKRILAGPIQYARRQSDQESIRLAAEPFGIGLESLTKAEYLAA